MAWSAPTTRSSGYAVTATNWNEFVNNFLHLRRVASGITTSNVLINTTTAATSVLLVAANTVTYEAVEHEIQVNIPAVQRTDLAVGSPSVLVGLYDSGTVVRAKLQQFQANSTAAGTTPMSFSYRLTPTAASTPTRYGPTPSVRTTGRPSRRARMATTTGRSPSTFTGPSRPKNGDLMEIITRQAWGAQPAESRTPWDPDDLVGVCVHHFAVPRSAATRAGSAALMRGVQRAHQAGEFNDIAYNHCFDKWGQIFEGRGFGFQTGANGNAAVNRTHAAICYMGNSDSDGFPDAAQKAAGWLLKQWFTRGTGMDVVPHSHLSPDGTACPGNNARVWVNSDAWKADLPTASRQVQYLLLDDGVIVDKSTRVPLAQSKGRWDKFRCSATVGDKSHRHMAAEGSRGTVQFVRKVTAA